MYVQHGSGLEFSSCPVTQGIHQQGASKYTPIPTFILKQDCQTSSTMMKDNMPILQVIHVQ